MVSDKQPFDSPPRLDALSVLDNLPVEPGALGDEVRKRADRSEPSESAMHARLLDLLAG